jgi:hypothetical protein
MILTFILFLVTSAFVGGLAGTILSVQFSELDRMTADDVLSGKPLPSSRLLLVLIFGVPAVILGQKLYQEMNPLMVFVSGFGCAILFGIVMFLVGKSR